MSDALVELESLLPELPAAVDRRRIGENLGKTATALQEAPRQVQRLKAVLDIARLTGFDEDQSQKEALDELIDEADRIATAMLMAATADDLRAVREDYEDVLRRIAAVDRQLRPHWRRRISRDFVPLIAIGRLLRGIGGISGLGDKLVSCGEDAQKSGDLAGAEALREAIVRLQARRAALESEREAIADDPEVSAFLNALASEQATLRLVTNRVRQWLENNGALDSFVVRASI